MTQQKMPDKLPPSTWPTGPSQITHRKVIDPVQQQLTPRPIHIAVNTQVMEGKPPVPNSYASRGVPDISRSELVRNGRK